MTDYKRRLSAYSLRLYFSFILYIHLFITTEFTNIRFTSDLKKNQKKQMFVYSLFRLEILRGNFSKKNYVYYLHTRGD